MWTDHVGAAKRELAGSRLRDVMRAHALTVHRTLKGAMDDVERQFREGMKPLLAAKLPGVDDTALITLITACIKAFRVGFDRPWAIPALEKQLQSSMLGEPLTEADAPPRAPLRAASSLATDPVGYLLGLALGSAELPLSETLRHFLVVTVARYLDPFLDGEVPAAQYNARSAGPFVARLKAAWAESPLNPGEAPLHIPTECVLGQYTAHAICKMNANFGFGIHTPGLGRQPASEIEVSRYFDQLGKAVVAAICRDFDEPDRQFGVRADAATALAAAAAAAVTLAVSAAALAPSAAAGLCRRCWLVSLPPPPPPRCLPCMRPAAWPRRLVVLPHRVTASRVRGRACHA
jgi:hypothetical protein